MTDENLIAKIRKLLALARDASEPNEAALAAAKAQELMVRHAISEARLEEKGSAAAANEPIAVQGLGMTTGKIPSWMARLSWKMAPEFCCQGYFTRGSDIYVVGRQTDREAHIATFTYLRGEIIRMCEAKWEQEQDYTDVNGKTWKTNFCDGAVAVIVERMEQEKRKLLNAMDSEDAAAGVAPTASTAIVLASRTDTIVKWMKEESGVKIKSSGTRRVTRDATAYEHGRQAGKMIDINARAPKGRLPGKGS